MVAHPLSTGLRPPPIARSLLACDALLIAAYLFFAFCVATGLREGIPWMFNIERSDSVPSLWNYAKWALAAGAMAIAFRASREPIHAAMAGTFAVILLDDAAEGHESIARVLVDRFGVADQGGVRGQDWMELAVLIALALACGIALALGYWRSGRAARRQAVTIGALFGALAVCVIGFDWLHSFVGGVVPGAVGALSYFTAGVLEDGGEMIVGSLLAAYAVGVAVRTGRAVRRR